MSSIAASAPLVATIDLDAITRNIARLREAAGAEVMAVLKANAYGHGAIPVARAAAAAGAPLGVAELDEAVALRDAGIDAPILFWLYPTGQDLAPAAELGIQVGVSSLHDLDQVASAAQRTARTVGIHLKIDTGFGRNGATAGQWRDLLWAVDEARASRLVSVEGVFSHLARADERTPAGEASVQQQKRIFELALAVAADVGVDLGVRHLANTPGAFAPGLGYDLVRSGLGIYGLSPFEGVSPAELGLTPALRLTSSLANLKDIGADHGVGYGHTYRTTRPTQLGIVPGGYGDGIPRAASDRAEVSIGGARHRLAGRVSMDQFALDLGDARVRLGQEVVLIGSGPGEPTVDDWAAWTGTINYEVVTRLGRRVARRYVGAAAEAGPR